MSVNPDQSDEGHEFVFEPDGGVRPLNDEDRRQGRAVKMLCDAVARKLGSRDYDVDIEYMGSAVLEFADEWKRSADNYIRVLEGQIDAALATAWKSDGEGGWIGPDGTSFNRREALQESVLRMSDWEDAVPSQTAFQALAVVGLPDLLVERDRYRQGPGDNL